MGLLNQITALPKSGAPEPQLVTRSVFSSEDVTCDPLPSLDELHDQIEAKRAEAARYKEQAMASLARLKQQVGDFSTELVKNLESFESEITKLQALVSCVHV